MKTAEFPDRFAPEIAPAASAAYTRCSCVSIHKGRVVAINTLIVDDEKPARDELAYLLKGFPESNVMAQGRNGVEAVALIKDEGPDLVFWEVRMPGVEGLAC